MKKILFLLLLILSSVISFSQRYTGYGRGYDFGDTEKIMNYQPSYWFALLLAGMMLIGGLTFLYYGNNFEISKGFSFQYEVLPMYK